MDNNIGYFRLTSFNENSSQQLKNKIGTIKNENEINGFILDLRNNPGGLLSQAVKISDFFLNDGEIVSTRGRQKRENRKWFAKKGDQIDGIQVQGKTLMEAVNLMRGPVGTPIEITIRRKGEKKSIV